MSGNAHLNGSDYLMLGFDHELRRAGFAGNACQIVLELAGPVSVEALKKSLETIVSAHSILRSRPGGLILPKWKSRGEKIELPEIREHENLPGIGQKLFNEPLCDNRGELMRFDLVKRAGGRASLTFTWAHALMDAPGAEYFLTAVGNETVALPDPRNGSPRRGPESLRERCKLAWKSLHHLDGYCRAAPRSPRARHQSPAAMRYLVERFSPEETARARKNGASFCGPLGDSQFHAAVAAVELHRLHQRLGCPSPSYVLPVPVGLRPKGTVEPVFSNQVAMLMVQFLPEHVADLATAVASLKKQMSDMMREGMLDSGVILANMFRFLPLPVYMAILKQGLRGEICSLFYGDTGPVNPLLTRFMGVEVVDFTHIAAVTPTPGIGVVFYYFRGELRVTVLHSEQVLDQNEGVEFAANIRARLLSP